MAWVSHVSVWATCRYEGGYGLYTYWLACVGQSYVLTDNVDALVDTDDECIANRYVSGMSRPKSPCQSLEERIMRSSYIWLPFYSWLFDSKRHLHHPRRWARMSPHLLVMLLSDAAGLSASPLVWTNERRAFRDPYVLQPRWQWHGDCGPVPGDAGLPKTQSRPTPKPSTELCLRNPHPYRAFHRVFTPLESGEISQSPPVGLMGTMFVLIGLVCGHRKIDHQARH